MKENKNKVLPIIIVIVGLIAIFGGYYMLNHQDETTTLTLLEKQWIETNKNQVFDYAFLSNTPIFNVDGKGVAFDFIEALEEATTLEFNKLSYSVGDNLKTDYAFKVVSKKSENDLLMFQDHYVLLTKEKTKYNSQNEIKDIVVGVLDDDVSSVSKYLNGIDGSFKTYASVDAMVLGLDSEVGAIVLPRVKYLSLIIENDLSISYHIVEMTQDYVFSLGDNKKLNTIVTKYFKKWYQESYEDSYNHYLTNNYLDFTSVDSKEKVKFRSKRYVYGFINNLPFDYLKNDSLIGVNSQLLKDYMHLAGIEVSYKQYSSLTDLLKGFNANEIDLFYNNINSSEYKMDVTSSLSPLASNFVIASPLKDNVVINSLQSLKDIEVSVLKDSAIAKMLKSLEIKIKEYKNISELVNSDKLMAIDSETYNYYHQDELKDYGIDYEYNIDDYNFVSRDIKDNTVFNNYFNFYLQYVDARNIVDSTYVTLLTKSGSQTLWLSLFNYGGYLVIVAFISYEGYLLIKRKKKNEPELTKADKLKYVDMLTSLKNRNYLNDNIEKWDSSDVYPQTIVIADLNNIAYINDNYGYQEGDKVIREAANILINNQIENSDIIRTNGNEFLIYMVGHDEKQVVSYIRKLNKEFKELSHDFGAAIGYSMVVDAIKTVDDAINEATLDMRTNKEEATNEQV